MPGDFAHRIGNPRVMNLRFVDMAKLISANPRHELQILGRCKDLD